MKNALNLARNLTPTPTPKLGKKSEKLKSRRERRKEQRDRKALLRSADPLKSTKTSKKNG